MGKNMFLILLWLGRQRLRNWTTNWLMFRRLLPTKFKNWRNMILKSCMTLKNRWDIFIHIKMMCPITAFCILWKISALSGYGVQRETKCKISALDSKTKEWPGCKTASGWDSEIKGSKGDICTSDEIYASKLIIHVYIFL